MRKKLLFVIYSLLELLFVIPVMSCGSDNDEPEKPAVIIMDEPEEVPPVEPTTDMDTISKRVVGAIVTVPGDDKDYEYLYEFFEKALPSTSMSWTAPWFRLDYNNVSYENHSDTCYVVNNYEDFQAIYVGQEQLPDIDFDSYTLLVGQKFSSSIYIKLNKQEFYEDDNKYVLDMYYADDFVSFAEINIFYWGLYPKLSHNNLEINIIIKRLNL